MINATSLKAYVLSAGTSLTGTKTAMAIGEDQLSKTQLDIPKTVFASQGERVSISDEGRAALSSLADQLRIASSSSKNDLSSYSYKELSAKAESLLDQITGPAFSNNRSIHDAEIPTPRTPERLEQAAAATDYLKGSGDVGSKSVNPFKGMARDQLAVIAYDSSGTFTVNERRAAWMESYDQESSWREQVVRQAQEEYDKTGALRIFFKAVLDHDSGLPDIERAQYPQDYAAGLSEKISGRASVTIPGQNEKGFPQNFYVSWLETKISY